jgi:hypothetical protein
MMTELSMKLNRNLLKKVLACVLAACLCIGTAQINAFASEAGQNANTIKAATTSGNGTETATATTSGNGTATEDKVSATSGNGTEAEHNFTTKITKATPTKNGSIVKTCTDCGTVEKTTIYKASSIKLSKTAYVYDGKAKKPSVTVKDSKGNVISKDNYTLTYSNNKTVGTATVTVKFKGSNYSGSKAVTYTIKPLATTLAKVTATTKGFKVTWNKKTTQTTGYQIRYSTSNKFTAAKTESVLVKSNKTLTKTVKNLKTAKKYYVQVRTYKTVDGKKYYSAWSDALAVTTK